jgi:chemotaxis protein methyltransferase CheR
MTAETQSIGRPLSGAEFRLFQDLIRREAGIFLSESKKALLVGRLSKRLRELGLASFGEYHRYVTREDPAERTRMLDCVSTNETHFFREPLQFAFLEERILPDWQAAAEAGVRPRRIRVWSAACSTGEEPYSLAMTLLSRFPPESGWEIEILGSDISTRVLDRAEAGMWPLERAAEIPERHLKRYMLRGTRSQEGKMKAGPELRSVVRFERINLNADSYPVTRRFDVIFCRNVLIYFDAPSKARVTRQLIRHLEPTGYFFLGHAESVVDMASELERVGPTIYAPVVNR